MRLADLKTCPLCDGPMVRAPTEVDLAIGRRTVKVNGRFLRCTNCREVFFRKGEGESELLKAAAEIREDEGLMTPIQIRALRNSLSLTQAQFELLLGVASKTVVRWERGTVFQNAATDSLLRVLAAVPSAVTFLRKRNLDGKRKKSA